MTLPANVIQQLHDNTITHLDLSNNRLGLSDVRELSEALATNKSLLSLNLTSAYLGNEGVTLLAAALKKNQTLKSLNLQDNAIGPPGAEALGAALAQNRGLEKINLDRNFIDGGGAYELAAGIEENFMVTELSLIANFMEDDDRNLFLVKISVERNREAARDNGREIWHDKPEPVRAPVKTPRAAPVITPDTPSSFPREAPAAPAANGNTLFQQATEEGMLEKAMQSLEQSGERITLDDLLARHGSTTLLEHIAEQGQLSVIFTPTNWIGHVREMQDAWANVPVAYQSQLDGKEGRPSYRRLLMQTQSQSMRTLQSGDLGR